MTSKRFWNKETTSDDADGGSGSDESSESKLESEREFSEPATPSQKRHTQLAKLTTSRAQTGLIVETTFDAYFTQNSAQSQTSSNIFSDLVPPLSPEEFATAIKSAQSGLNGIQPLILTEPTRSILFTRYWRELDEGFNLLFYGLGSKRKLLNQFAVKYCSRAGHVVVVNGFQPDFTLKHLLSSIEKVPGLSSFPLTSLTVENQARRIRDFFISTDHKHHLYLIVHNIDSPALRSSKSKYCLSLLALCPRIHLLASVDHLNAPLLWSSSELSSRKYEQTENFNALSRGFAWLWHDLTTFDSYNFELMFVDRSSISGAHEGGRKQRDVGGAAAQAGVLMTDTAAMHILASVTQKAQKLFALMGSKQLEKIAEGTDMSTTALQQFGIGYDTLWNAARDNFIATNDTALRSLLGEFRDHGLVLGIQNGPGGGEVLWIPLRKERLFRVLSSIPNLE